MNEKHLHFEPVGTPVDICQSVNAETAAACRQLGRDMAERLMSDRA